MIDLEEVKHMRYYERDNLAICLDPWESGEAFVPPSLAPSVLHVTSFYAIAIGHFL